jgi:hypothetical protein
VLVVLPRAALLALAIMTVEMKKGKGKIRLIVYLAKDSSQFFTNRLYNETRQESNPCLV